jgi:hypothetical protein
MMTTRCSWLSLIALLSVAFASRTVMNFITAPPRVSDRWPLLAAGGGGHDNGGDDDGQARGKRAKDTVLWWRGKLPSCVIQ